LRFFDCFNTTVNIYMLSAPQQRDDEDQEHTTSGGLLRAVPVNVVQSIRAFRVTELQSEAIRLEQHFLYANCAQALTRQQVLVSIAESFQLPKPYGKNYDALRDCLTNVFHKAGEQPGFLVVLEQLPNTQKFDKEARENLLDVFRDAADFWAEKKVPFRAFFSFQ
jgi:RNAse (barnase) inhibitor barstar